MLHTERPRTAATAGGWPTGKGSTVEQDTHRLPITSNGEVVAYTLVDEDVYRWARHLPWNLQTGGYARSNWKYLHRIVADIDEGDPRFVDHINRDKLDNRRANLRAIDQSVNNHNLPALTNGRGVRGRTSRFRGVYRHKKDYADGSPRWSAQVRVNDVQRFVGYFRNEEEAAHAALAARRELMSHADPDQLAG